MKFLMMAIYALLLILDAVFADGLKLPLNREIQQNQAMSFVSHRGPQKFDNALAMNIVYEPVRHLRRPIEKVIGRPLQFLQSWDQAGEAHVTVITPPEYASVLGNVLSMDEIEEIALRHDIQAADIRVLGLGSGSAVIESRKEETFYIIVESVALRQIRLAIYRAFVRKGGNPDAWNPNHWFPHVTIGYTKRDLHENDGVIKNIASKDSRFELVLE